MSAMSASEQSDKLFVDKQRNGAPESLLNLSNYALEPNYQA